LFWGVFLSLIGQSVVPFSKKLQIKARRHVPLAAGLPPQLRCLLTIVVVVRHGYVVLHFAAKH
jgi:hypothetical protein